MRADASVPVYPAPPRRAWAGTLLAALFIALASALLPGAIPASQMVGSAFNPATTQVALSRDESDQTGLATQHKDRQRDVLAGGDDDPAAAIIHALSPGIASLPLSADAPHRAAAQPQREVFVRPGAGPRAPPTLA